MTIKTALLASAAAFMFAAPALAQETPATAPTQAPAAAAASQQSLSLNPGMTVSGPDGELGKLEGVQNNAEGKQELTVRGADGQLRAVPLSGIRQENGGVAVAYTKAEYDAAAAIPGAPAAPAPAADPAAAPTAPAADPAAQPTDPSATPPTTAPDAAEPAPAPTEPN